MELKSLFDQATVDIKNVSSKPGNDILLQLYSLFKQATEGDNNAEPPSNMFDFVAKAKYDTWAGLKGKSKDAAMEEYVALVETLKNG